MLTLATRLRMAGASYLSAPGWLQTFAGGSGATADALNSIKIDSSGNIYAVGQASIGGVNTGFVIKMTPSGGIVWQRKLTITGGVTSGSEGAGGINVDASGSVYAVVICTVSAIATPTLLKFNSAGVLQWQRSLAAASSASAGTPVIDASGNVFYSGHVQSAINTVFLVKYNSSGVIQWQRKMSHATYDVRDGFGCALDSTGAVYVAGTWQNKPTYTSYRMLLVKWDTSGAIQWQKDIAVGTLANGYGLTIDSSNNIYVTGDGLSGSSRPVIAKLTSAGALTWAQYLSASGSIARPFVNSAGDVFAVLANGQSFFKWNSSGTLQFQRAIKGTVSSAGSIRSISVDADYAYIAGIATRTATSSDGVVAKLPISGAGQGEYGWVTYFETTATSTSITPTIAASTFVEGVNSLTDAAGGATDASGSLITEYFNKT